MKNSASKTNPHFKSLQGLQILLAEDNLLNTKLITILFAQQGLTIQLAANGLEAIEKIRSTHFDLVLMDMEMPVMSGYDATVIIRNELKSDIPIIALTAHAGADEKEKCMLLGMNDYITKPIDSIRLFNSIQTLTRQISPAGSTPGNSGTATTISDKICNMDYLMGATHGNKKIIHSIVGVFFKETKKELGFLDAAIKKTNYPVIRDISHKIKSAFSILGILALDPVFTEMEQLSSSTSCISNIAELNRKVHLVFKQARAEMMQDGAVAT